MRNEMKKFKIQVKCFDDDNDSNNAPYFGGKPVGSTTCVVVGCDDYGKLLEMMTKAAQLDLAIKKMEAEGEGEDE